MRLWMLLLVAASRLALAQESDDAALALADRTNEKPSAQRTCLEYAEAAASLTTYSTDAPSTPGGRMSFSVRCDGEVASGWRGVFSDRFDEFVARGASAQGVNTLKEAYMSFTHGAAVIVDLGRINVREGVALAYNPTDFFRADAVRAVVSIDPNTLRDERMGTLMGRAQALWSSGSLTTILVPRVAAPPNESTFNPDLGATNGAARWLLIWSQRLLQDFQPQFLLTGAQHQSPQAALNLTHLINQATVAYLEWSGGRGHDLSASADVAFRSRLSAGLTYTTPYKLSLTLEYEYDGASPGGREWSQLRDGPIPLYVRYRRYAAAQGELATRQNVFAYAQWDDVVIPHLGLTAFTRFDPYDHSRLTWSQASYHWQHAGIAVQWQRGVGAATSDLAPAPMLQTWLAQVDYYF